MIKTHQDFVDKISGIYPTCIILGNYINAKTKISFQCSKGHLFSMLPGNILRGQKCPYCSNRVRKTTEQFKRELAVINPNISVIGEYTNAHTNIKVRCQLGHEWEVHPNNLLGKRSGCPICSNRAKLTQEEFIDKIKKINPTLTVIGQYINAKTPILMQCKAGHQWKAYPASLSQGMGCGTCAGNQKKTQEQFVQELSLVKPEFKVLGEYKSSNSKIEVQCGKGHIFNVAPNQLLNRPYGCPHCSGIAKRTHEGYIEELKRNNINILPLEQYQGSDTKILHQCLICNRIYKRSPFRVLNRACSHCFRNGTSKQEQDVLDYVSSMVEVEHQKHIDGMIVDIFVPSHHLAIEYNGLYWHCDKHKKKNDHADRTQKLQQHGIRTIQIFEDEWIEKKDIVKDKLAHILGKSKIKPSVYARKCNIQCVSSDIARTFMETNHIQGYCNSTYKYGLFYGERLVALMLLNKPQISRTVQYKQRDEIELSRFATDIECNVLGGFSKLLNYAIKQHKQIYTFADLRWVDPNNNVYTKNGFKEYNRNSPGYDYVRFNAIKTNISRIQGHHRYYRFMFRKSGIYKHFPDLKNSRMTEREMMEYMGFHRIYNCGTISYRIGG